jgi:peptide/nickel transport system substrate-binding protein
MEEAQMTKTHIPGLGATARSRGLNRREFIQTALAAGFTVAAAEAMFASAARAEGKRGGVFRVGLGGASTTDTLDPATYISTTTQIAYSSGVHNQLVEFMPDGTVKPELAESIEASPDAKTWTFKLRPGVEFHNGKTLTADDVIASINHHRGEESKSAMKPLLAPVREIRADGPQTVVVTLEAGNADFPFLMNDYHMPIMPAKDGKADWQSGVGAGAYRLAKNDPGVRIELTRNPNYYKPDRGWFDECVVLGIADAAARQAALQAGDVDAINDVDRKTAGQRRDRRGDGHAALHHSDGCARRAVQQCRCAARAEVRHRPRSDGEHHPVWPRPRRQRSPDRAGEPLLRRRPRTARL